jgi:gliding motility-associated-like protein
MKKILFTMFLCLTAMGYGQGPGCPNVNAGPDVSLDCTTNCVDLNATFLLTGQTTAYTVSSVPFNPPFPSFGGTPTSVNMDDRWSSIINLPFNFCFYGNVFNRILVGSNGNITFNTAGSTTTPGGTCGYTLAATDQIPIISNALVGNSINGVLHDIDPRYGNASINYSVIGAAPCRTFVVNYARVPIYGSPQANSSETTTQIVLYETTNVIEIYVRAKPDSSPSGSGHATTNGGRAVLGIQNANGTQGAVPPGRNTGIWSAALEAWRFTPSGTPNYTFSWRDAANNILSNSPAYTHCVTGNETITARVEYLNCNGNLITATDDVIIDIPSPTINLGPDQIVCDIATPVVLNSGLTGSGTISWSNGSGVIAGETGPTLSVTQSGTYTVNYNEMFCSATDTVQVTINASPTATQPSNIFLCDTSGTNALTASFNLGAQNAAILNGQSNTTFEVSYHSSQTAADANTGALNTSAYTNTAPTETIYARVQNAAAPQCFTTTSFNIQVDPQAQFNAVNDIEVCDDDSNDGIATFDLTTQTAGVLGSQNAADFTITYHTSNADAQAGTPAITNPASYMNNGNPQIIYVRVTPVANATCFATGTFQLIVAQQAIANSVTPLVQCDDASNDGIATYDLTTSIAEVLGTQDPNNFTVTVHVSQADADNDVNPVAVNFMNTTAPQTLIARIENNANTTCFRTTPISLILNEAPRITTPADLVLCDDVSGDGVEIFDLTLNNTDLLNGLNSADYTITYYLNQNDANTGANPISSSYLNTTSPEAIFVRVVNNMTSCVNTVSFDIILNPIPVTTAVNTIEECDDDLDGTAVFSLSDRKTAIINGQTNRSVLFYANAADAIAGTNAIDENNYTNTSNPQTISYRLVNDSTGCYAIGDFIIEAVAAPSITMPSDVENCDDGTGVATANLEASTAGVIGSQMGLRVTYHNSQAAANSTTNALSSPYDYTADETVFVRVEDLNSGCVSFTTLDLIFNELPQPLLLEQYIICKDPAGNLLNGPAVLNSGLDNGTYSFVWTRDGNIIAGATQAIYNATEPGDYVVIATNRLTGCSDETSTVVRQSGAPQIYDVQVTTDPFSFQHNVIVTASGPDIYWFRLDDGPYENSGIFNNVAPGPHTVTIAERNGCGEIIVDIFVFGYPDYFTPNNDGYHDTWNIIGGDLLPGTKLYIFDRYGKLLKQLDPSGAGWDGTYNGQPLPSSDYWFRIEYLYENRSANASGHFAMKR